MSAQSKKGVGQLFVYLVILFLLAISAFSLKNYSNPIKVLGATSQEPESNKEAEFWNDFLSKNPNYIPGWVEIGRMDKVKEIDPNFKLDTSN